MTERQIYHLTQLQLLPQVGSGNRLEFDEVTARCVVVGLELARSVIAFRSDNHRTPGKGSRSVLTYAVGAAMAGRRPPSVGWVHLSPAGTVTYAEDSRLPLRPGVVAWFDCAALDHRVAS